MELKPEEEEKLWKSTMSFTGSKIPGTVLDNLLQHYVMNLYKVSGFTAN